MDRLAARVRTVVTVSTPHHGTPLASFFTTMQGQRLLKLLAVGTIYVLQFGRLPLSALLWMGSIFARFDDLVVNNELLDELFGRLLTDFTPARRRSVRAMLREVVGDQALMLQLTPEAMDVFNAAVVRRPGVRYGSVVAQAPRPSIRSRIGAGLDPGAQVTRESTACSIRSPPRRRTISRPGSRRRSPDSPAHLRSGTVGRRQRRHRADALAGVGGGPPCCDCRSPRRARLLPDATHDPPHVDWVVTGSGFTRPRFEALWGDVHAFSCANLRAQCRGGIGAQGAVGRVAKEKHMKRFNFRTLGLHAFAAMVLGAAASSLLAATSVVASTAGLEPSLSRGRHRRERFYERELHLYARASCGRHRAPAAHRGGCHGGDARDLALTPARPPGGPPDRRNGGPVQREVDRGAGTTRGLRGARRRARRPQRLPTNSVAFWIYRCAAATSCRSLISK